jgi:chloramphenicol 3-O phosphotransferase
MKKGNIILLNGTSSSGKSTIAQALQKLMAEPYLHTGVDHFLRRLPESHIVYSDGHNPASAAGWLAVFEDHTLVEVRIGSVGLRVITGMYHAIAAYAAAGNQTIVDDVIYDRRVLKAAVTAFSTSNVLFVGVRCPLEVAESREQARGDRARGGARTFYQDVHAHKVYDLEVDSSLFTPAECALQIKQAIQEGVPRTALRQLAAEMESSLPDTLSSRMPRMDEWHEFGSE